MLVYIIEDLESARKYIKKTRECLIITNPPNSTKYYGMMVLDYVFKILQNEYPNKITDILVNVGDDHAACLTAIKLGYHNINYTGNSKNIPYCINRNLLIDWSLYEKSRI